MKHMKKMEKENTYDILSMDMESCEKAVKSNIEHLKAYSSEKIVFFHTRSFEIGALEVNVQNVIGNIEYVMSLTSLFNGGLSFFLVDGSMIYALCLWLSEYDLKVYKW